MAITNGPAGTKRRATAKRAHSDRPATDRLRKQASKVTEDLQEIVGTARDAARENLGQLRENAAECYEQGRDRVQNVERALEHSIRTRPFLSVLIAAGVGLLLGRFGMRR